MPQAILPRFVENPYLGDDNKKQIQGYQENQEVECNNISSTNQNGEETEEEEDEDDDIEFDNAIVVNDRPHLPHFGSVSVVNSNDVHFGNKTVYKGPVTIKQFVYPKIDANSDFPCGLNGLIGCENKTIPPSGDGVENKGFIKDETGVVVEDKPEEREQETIDVAYRIIKGVKWFKTIPFRKPKETMLFLFLLVISATTISAVLIWRNPAKVIRINNDGENEEEDSNRPVEYSSDANAALSSRLRMVNRIDWLAQPPSGSMSNLTLPVSVVIIQHTATESCNSQASCVLQTRTIQTFHMESRSWSDIGYNFLIGGDGAVYEGRGWTIEGAHTQGHNSISIGVGFIGTFNTKLPSDKMINAFHNLVAKGVKLGYLTENYKILAARQFSGTESPGKAFYDVIKTWKHWAETLEGAGIDS